MKRLSALLVPLMAAVMLAPGPAEAKDISKAKHPVAYSVRHPIKATQSAIHNYRVKHRKHKAHH